MAKDKNESKRPSDLSNLVRGHRGRMTALALASFAGALVEAGFLVLLTAVGMALVADSDVVGPFVGQTTTIPTALTLAALLLCIRLVLSLGAVVMSAGLTARVTSEQRLRLAHAFLLSSWEVQSNEPAGRLQELLTTFVSRSNQAVATLAQALTSILSLAAFLVTSLVVNPLATLAVMILLVVVGALLTPLRKLIRARSREYSQSNLAFANAVSEFGSLGMEMQTFGVQDRFIGKIDDLTHTTISAQRRVNILSDSLSPLYSTLAYGAALGGVALLSSVRGFSFLDIGAVMLLMLRSLGYGQQLASALGKLASATPFLERVRIAIDKYSSSPATQGEVVAASATPLVANDVDFGYVEGRTALAGASFKIDPGEVVGVIGPSGAGKSTLAQLLLGLREPSAGSISVAGVPLKDVQRDWWTERMVFVAQDARLFTGTVAENIRFFREGIDDEQLRTAARKANLLVDIESLSDGFDTHLGERGSQLSGGQRQRLSIARALAGSPEFLVLDEPTSALDGRSESLIRETLDELRGQVTIVLIAHRMSTLDICDRIMVVEDGRITAFDKPSSLVQSNAFYRSALQIAGVEVGGSQ